MIDRLRTGAMLGLVCLPLVAIGQAGSDTSEQTVQIRGNVATKDGQPAYLYSSVNLAKRGPEGWQETSQTQPGANGDFSFSVAAGETYRVSLNPGFTAMPIVVKPVAGVDIDMGEIVLEHCPPPPEAGTNPLASPPPAGGYLADVKIVIEARAGSTSSLHPRPVSEQAETSRRIAADKTFELPPCWYEPSLERRGEWGNLRQLQFFHWVGLADLVGGPVKSIHVVNYAVGMTPRKIKEEVRKVWLGSFHYATPFIGWDEGAGWNVRAEVEFYTGQRVSLLTDGLHVEVQDKEGHYWYLREWPAID